AHSDPGRGHVGAGQRIGAPGAVVARAPDVGANDSGHCPPFIYRPESRQDSGARCRTDCRTRPPRRTAGTRWFIRFTVSHAVQRGRLMLACLYNRLSSLSSSCKTPSRITMNKAALSIATVL